MLVSSVGRQVHKFNLQATPEVLRSLHKLTELHNLAAPGRYPQAFQGAYGGMRHGHGLHGRRTSAAITAQEEEMRDLEAAAAAPGGAGGVVSSCRLSHGGTEVVAELCPLMHAAAASSLRDETGPWPPRPSALVSSNSTLASWLDLAVTQRQGDLEAELESEQALSSLAMASLASRLSLAQTLLNLPVVVQLQLLAAFALVAVLTAESAILLSNASSPDARP